VLGTIKSGRLNALAVATESRSPLLSEVPTVAESGVPGFVFSTWTGVFAPKNTPQPILQRLNAEIVKVLADPVIRERYQALGATPRPTTPEQLSERTRDTFAKMARVIKETGIKSE
jgi:tripartite-type tricarboxylate transporter receptor subunit TctC